jgi:rod shape-determining protein MreC
VSFKVKAKKNPTVLLLVLLALHWAAVSLNQVPGRTDRRYVQVWLTALLAPFQSGATIVGSAIGGVWHRYFYLRDAQAENERLRAERAQLEAELLRWKEGARLARDQADLLQEREQVKRVAQLRAEATRLQAELDQAPEADQRLQLETALRQTQEQLRYAEQLQAQWQATQPYPKVVGQVISRDAYQWFDTVVINRGWLQGVSKDQPVVTSEGLVGRVIEVAPNASRVMLLTDERHGAGAMIIGQLAASRTLGVVKGKNGYLCEMKFVAGSEKVEPGELVVTSGQDGLYPKGLVLGRVRRVETGSPTTPFVIEIEPGAPLSKLDLVSVLLSAPGQDRAPLTELRALEQAKQAPPSARKKR